LTAISLGPIVLAADRFAAVLGIFTFILVTGIITRRVDDRFGAWTWWALLGGIAAARLGHVILHWQSFAAEPLRIFALWQGGFHMPTALAAILLSIIIVLRGARLRLWALLPLALAFVVWNTATQLTGGTQAIALPASAFRKLDGDIYSLREPSGKPMVINLWATWCPPCRREMPMIAELAGSMDEADFVFANQGESRDAIDRYLADNEIALDHVLLDSFGELARHYGAPGLPATLFISADGVLKHAHLGEISRETLESRISRLFTEQD